MKVFLSHSTKDKQFVQSLAKELESLPPPEYGRRMMPRSLAARRKAGNVKTQTTKPHG
jgi:hypothetical protein